MASKDQIAKFEVYLQNNHPYLFIVFNGQLGYLPKKSGSEDYGVSIFMGKEYYTDEQEKSLYKAWHQWEDSIL
jgi:hypothetical protein